MSCLIFPCPYDIQKTLVKAYNNTPMKPADSKRKAFQNPQTQSKSPTAPKSPITPQTLLRLPGPGPAPSQRGTQICSANLADFTCAGTQICSANLADFTCAGSLRFGFTNDFGFFLERRHLGTRSLFLASHLARTSPHCRVHALWGFELHSPFLLGVRSDLGLEAKRASCPRSLRIIFVERPVQILGSEDPKASKRRVQISA